MLWSEVRYFSASEFVCRCGCGLNNISLELVYKLDELRCLFGSPIVVNSACRCPSHNLSVGGSSSSSHLYGLAVDIKVLNSLDRFKLVELALKLGFNRVGIAKDFIHLDIDNVKTSSVLWVY